VVQRSLVPETLIRSWPSWRSSADRESHSHALHKGSAVQQGQEGRCAMAGRASMPATFSRVNTGGSIAATLNTEDSAPVVPVAAAAEVHTEITQIAAQLDLSKEWDTRITALKRLHGITLGGAAAHGNFLEELKTTLRDPLRAQMSDRRSQACPALRALSTHVQQRLHVFVPFHLWALVSLHLPLEDLFN
jgi:hypothetical protein